MTEYQIRWGYGSQGAGTSLVKARATAIKFLEMNKHQAYVGIFGNTPETVKTKYGRVGRTNTIFYTWETPIKGGGYKLENFLNSEGKIITPPQWFFHNGNFYY